MLLFTTLDIPADKGDNGSPTVALAGVLAGVGGAEHTRGDIFTTIRGIAVCVGYDGHICLRVDSVYFWGEIFLGLAHYSVFTARVN